MSLATSVALGRENAVQAQERRSQPSGCRSEIAKRKDGLVADDVLGPQVPLARGALGGESRIRHAGVSGVLRSIASSQSRVRRYPGESSATSRDRAGSTTCTGSRAE
jgi:hypothetical protein